MDDINLILGDCLEKMKDIPDGSVDFILTDPPYGTTACKWDTVIPFEPMWGQIWRVLKPNGACALFGSEPFSSNLRMSQIKFFKYDWIWEKSKCSNFLHASYAPLKAHEIISIFIKKGKPTYNPQYTKGKPYSSDKVGRRGSNTDTINNVPNPRKRPGSLDGKRKPRTVQYFRTSESEGRYHPTQKPVALLEYFIKTYTLENETVLDFTMGSGSTGVAAQNLNRKFIGIEKENKYFEIAKQRIESNKS